MSGIHSQNTRKSVRHVETRAQQCFFEVDSVGLSDLLLDLFPDRYSVHEKTAKRAIERARREARHK